MYTIIADTHTHTLASGHAYSTITENARAAAEKGLRYLAVTDHTGRMPQAPHPFYFANLHTVPDQLCGVRILHGCEVNIVDGMGTLDLDERVLARLDWVIASMHPPVFSPLDVRAHTDAWLRVAENPHVDVIGHCGDGRYPFDLERVIPAFAAHGKIVEINSHSFEARPGSTDLCRQIALLCRQHGVRVAVSSDAHFWTEIGVFDHAVAMLASIDFPEELIVNADPVRFAALAEEKQAARSV